MYSYNINIYEYKDRDIHGDCKVRLDYTEEGNLSRRKAPPRIWTGPAPVLEERVRRAQKIMEHKLKKNKN